jgi:hypothetical protein
LISKGIFPQDQLMCGTIIRNEQRFSSAKAGVAEYAWRHADGLDLL